MLLLLSQLADGSNTSRIVMMWEMTRGILETAAAAPAVQQVLQKLAAVQAAAVEEAAAAAQLLGPTGSLAAVAPAAVEADSDGLGPKRLQQLASAQ